MSHDVPHGPGAAPPSGGGVRAEACREILEHVGAAIALVEEDGRLSWTNAAFERITGCMRAGQAGGIALADLATPEGREQLLACHRARALDPGAAPRSCHTSLRSRRGDELRVELTLTVIPGTTTSIASLIDVTEQERAERELRTSDERHRALSHQFDAILNAIPDTLVLISPELRVLWANRAAAEKLGTTEAEIAGRRCHEVWHCRSTPCPICPVQASLDSHRSENGEVVDPAGRTWELTTVPVAAGDGTVSSVVELARDVTLHRRLEQRLAHAQKLEAVGRLAGTVAHDFNNFIAAILGFTELALLELPEGATAREPLEQAHEAARDARTVTRQLLAFSRREPARRRPVDLAALLAARTPVLRQLAGGATLEIAAAPDLAPVLADPVQLDQVLTNLVVNAREAMPAGGTVTVGAVNRRIAAGDGATDLAPGEYVVLSVADTGRGMDAATLGRLFEPYFTTKASGTGLGLATVHGVARASGGDVRVESAPGKGTRVEVILPRAEPGLPAAGGNPAEETA